MDKVTVTRPSRQDLEELGVTNWGIWTCDVSRFDWHYDRKETCYLLDGEVTVTTGDQQVRFAAGDLVTFPEGLDCVWDVTTPVKKYYKFG